MAGLRILINKFTSAHCHHLVFMRLTWAVNCAPRVSSECLGGWCWFFRHFVDFFFFKKKNEDEGNIFPSEAGFSAFSWQSVSFGQSAVAAAPQRCAYKNKWPSRPRQMLVFAKASLPRFLFASSVATGTARRRRLLGRCWGICRPFLVWPVRLLALIDADDTALDNELITNKSVAMRTRRRWRTQLASDAN